MEMVGALVHQLTRNLKDSQIQDSAFAPYFVDHTVGVYPTAASGFPWSAASIQSTGDVIADLSEDMAADAAVSQEQHSGFFRRLQTDPTQAFGHRLHCGRKPFISVTNELFPQIRLKPFHAEQDKLSPLYSIFCHIVRQKGNACVPSRIPQV